MRALGRSTSGVVLVLCAAYAWLLGNAFYVHFLVGRQRTYRVEAAAFIFATIAAVVAFRDFRLRVSDPGAPWIVRILLTTTGVAVLSVYATLFTFPFLSDDYVFLSRYAGETGDRWEFFRPVFGLVFAGLAEVGGRATWPFHIAAVSLHLANTALVFCLAERLLRARSAAALAAMLFALNPVQAEAVLWVSGLQELLWTAFGLASILVYVRHERPRPRDLLLSATLFALALGSKETAICLLLLFPAADVFLVRESRWRRQVPAYAIFGLVAAGYLLIRFTQVDSPAAFFTAPSRYFLKQFFAVPYAAFIQPWNEAVIDVPPWLRLVTVVALPSVILAAAWRRALNAGVLAGPALMVIGALPVYSYFFVSSTLQGSRYLYFPALGWGLLVGYLVIQLCTSSRAMLLASVCLFVWSASWLVVNLRPWHEAARIVEEFRAGAAGASSAAHRWEERYGDELMVRQGVPVEYRGVVIFRNGYREFIAMRDSGALPR